MQYIIVNTHNTPLSAIHSNGWTTIKDVFSCSNKNYMFFLEREEAQEYLDCSATQLENQRERWGDWTDKAIKFMRSLKIVELHR